MLLQEGFIPVMGDRVEVQIDDTPIVQAQIHRPVPKNLLKLQDVHLSEPSFDIRFWGTGTANINCKNLFLLRYQRSGTERNR